MPQDSNNIIDKELRRIEHASKQCEMCQLHEAREVMDREMKQSLSNRLFVAKLKDRERRRTIGNLYMALAFVAGFACYLFVRSM